MFGLCDAVTEKMREITRPAIYGEFRPPDAWIT